MRARNPWVIRTVLAVAVIFGFGAVAHAKEITLKAASAFPKTHANNVGFSISSTR